MPVLIEEVVRGVTSAHGADTTSTTSSATSRSSTTSARPPLVRDAIDPAALTDLAPIMGGDDFSAYLAEVPGCYAFIGAGDEDSGATFPHHHPRFRIDERALGTGVRLHVDVAVRALKEVHR